MFYKARPLFKSAKGSFQIKVAMGYETRLAHKFMPTDSLPYRYTEINSENGARAVNVFSLYRSIFDDDESIYAIEGLPGKESEVGCGKPDWPDHTVLKCDEQCSYYTVVGFGFQFVKIFQYFQVCSPLANSTDSDHRQAGGQTVCHSPISAKNAKGRKV